MCAGAKQRVAALRVCAELRGVHSGAKHHRPGAHGTAPAPAGQRRHGQPRPVLQRVSLALLVHGDSKGQFVVVPLCQ